MSLPQWWGGFPPCNYPARQKTRSEQTDTVGRTTLARHTDVVTVTGSQTGRLQGEDENLPFLIKYLHFKKLHFKFHVHSTKKTLTLVLLRPFYR